MKKVLSVVCLLFVTVVGIADTSDYIWNQQFEKKIVKAQAGDLKSQYDIGNMYLKGQGTARNEKEAFKWFNTAAKKGYARAQYKLGYLYHRGEGAKKNNSRAFNWVSKSAQQGYKPAMYYVGKLYAEGEGVVQDINKALEWHKKSYAAGYNPAKREITRLEAKIAAANKRNVAFDPRPKRVAKASAKPKPRAKQTVSRGIRLDEKATKELLLNNKWSLKNKPAESLPSVVTKCEQKQGRLSCKSKELEYDEPYGVISYIVQTKFSDFSNQGEFTAEYNKNITLIFPNDPDDPDVVIPLEYGPQKKELMRCKLTTNDVVCYRGEKREKVVYSRI